MIRILMTGGAGFVGREVLKVLCGRDVEIHLLGRRPVETPGVYFHKVDLLDCKAVDAVVDSVAATHVLHLAWYTEPGLYWRSPLNLDWIGATLNLASRAQMRGAQRLVAAGSCAEYLWGAPRFHETDSACEPATLYGVAKDATRRVLQSFATTTTTSFAWARLFFLYGPEEVAGRLISDAVDLLSANARFPTSHGRQRRDFMHVEDAGRALAELLFSDVQGPVNVASGQAMAVREIVALIAAELGSTSVIEFGAKPLGVNEPETIQADISRLLDELGFRPRHDLQSGLKDCLNRRLAAWPMRSLI